MNGASADRRRLAGLRVGISIAASEESGARGYDPAEVNRCMVRLAEALLGHGAQLVLGQDWRPGGVMENIALLAQQYAAVLRSDGPRPIINFVPWSPGPALSRPGAEWESIEPLLEVRGPELPEPLRPFEREAAAAPVLRAAALTHLREVLNGNCDARICLGGKMQTYEGWFPGILEEAWLAAESGKPLYVSGMLGGASAAVIRAIDLPDGETYLPRPDLVERAREIDGGLLKALRIPGPIRFSRETRFGDTGLDADERRQLFDAREIDDVIVLVLRGLLGIAGG